MNRKKIFWHIFPSFLILIILSLIITTWYSTQESNAFYQRQTIEDLKSRALIFASYLSSKKLTKKQIDPLCDIAGKKSKTKITVILPNGVVIGDSEKNPNQMENHINRPEIIGALKHGIGWQIRNSNTLNQKMMYVAIPYIFKNSVIAVIRTSIPMTSFSIPMLKLNEKIILLVGTIAIIAGLICIYITKRIVAPLEEIKNGIDEIKNGNLSKKLPIPKTEEIAVISEAFNDMTKDLSQKIERITKNKNEQQAIFASMSEGVLAIDNNERIIRINDAAESILKITKNTGKGKMICEIIRIPELINFINELLSATKPIETEIYWETTNARHFYVSGTILKDYDGVKIGAVIVLNDITRIHKLEKIRSDFVANVSHELRTPITSISGFAEVLLDEGIQEPEKTKHYAQIIVKQSKRLNNIINDLLTLSKIEDGSQSQILPFINTEVKQIIDAAIQACSTLAAEKDMKLIVDCNDEFIVKANQDLLETAIKNLIENAIKYSEPQKEIFIKCEREKDFLNINVIDNGFGISKEHQERIFERFYRVDKARSRNQGGTGLGLSIVKHIAITHNGSVFVKSNDNQGSTFTIQLAMNNDR